MVIPTIHKCISSQIYFIYIFYGIYIQKCIYITARSAMSISSSLKSENLHLPGEEGYAQYDGVIEGLNNDLENVRTALKEHEDAEAGDRVHGVSTIYCS